MPLIPYHSFYIHVPKRRMISAAPFQDRVAHHALCNVIEPIFERSFISDSYANRVGKGTHRALDRAQQFARPHPFSRQFRAQRRTSSATPLNWKANSISMSENVKKTLVNLDAGLILVLLLLTFAVSPLLRSGLQEHVRGLRAWGVTIGGDVVYGDKVGGDKVAGDKIVVSGGRRWESLKPLRGAEDAEK